MKKKKSNIFTRIRNNKQISRILNNKKVKRVLNIFSNSFKLFQKHDTSTQGAALSYFTIFSIAPMLFIIISIAGAILGPEAVQGQITGQLQELIGKQSAVEIQNIIKSAYKPGKNILFTIIAVVVLALGATGMFGQLRTALNTIWDVKPAAKKPVIKFFLTKLFSFAMIACMAFLMLVTLVVQSALHAFIGYLSTHLPSISVILITVFDIALSLAVTTVLFAFVYKFMSDAKPKWHSVWWGAFFTTVMFNIGRYLIGLYLGQSSFTTTYGAGASIVIVMVWVYYSSQIIFFGAEFTRAIAIERGIPLDPKAIADDIHSGISVTQKRVLKHPKKMEPKAEPTPKKQASK